jgi:hypothetical protein
LILKHHSDVVTVVTQTLKVMNVKDIDWSKITEALMESSLVTSDDYETKTTYISDDVLVGEIVGFIKGEIEMQE